MAADHGENLDPSAVGEKDGSVASKDMGHVGIRSMQGGDEIASTVDSSEAQVPNMTLRASEFRPETKTALKNLYSSEEILSDDSGKKAEEATQIVLKHEGLPTGNDERQELKEVVPGQYNEKGHGIDLIGVTPDGRPILIEVKRRRGADDTMGDHEVELEKQVGETRRRRKEIQPGTLELRDDIVREREINPALRYKDAQDTSQESYDKDMSTRQMAGLWTRDRWLQLINDEQHRAELVEAGVREEFLNSDNLKVADSPRWREILDSRTTVIVSGKRDDVSDRLFRQAVFERGCDVCLLNLEE